MYSQHFSEAIEHFEQRNKKMKSRKVFINYNSLLNNNKFLIFSTTWDKFEFTYTPKHGSWLNMAEIELNVLLGQCLNRRIDNIEKVMSETAAWQSHRNNKNAKVKWQFTTDDARIKLSRLYPSIETWHDT